MVYAPPGLTRVSQQQIGAAERTCLYDGLCASPDLLTEALAAVGTLAFAVAFVLALTRLHDARTALDAERERTKQEEQAFEQFVEAVARINPETPRLTDGGRATTTSAGGHDLAAVVGAYEDAILNLDHYDEEYDDTLAEHMAAEFGEDVALAVKNGGFLSPQLQETLCRTGLQAKERRERLLDALDAEAASLDAKYRELKEATAVLDDVDADDSRDRTELVSDWHAVREVGTNVEALLAERQADIHEQRHVVGGGDGPTALYEYVYDSQESTYPVLSVGTSLLARANTCRRDLSRSLVQH